MFWLLIKCQRCNRTGCLPDHRQHTSYNDDRLNWAGYYCPPCAAENVIHWEDMWAEYNAGRL